MPADLVLRHSVVKSSAPPIGCDAVAKRRSGLAQASFLSHLMCAHWGGAFMVADGMTTIDDVIPAQGYAGDIAPKGAWEILKREADAVLVDVRTTAEWNYVGTPDLRSLNKQPVPIEWQIYPTMQVNPGFAEAMRAAGVSGGRSVLFLCRSGVRSKAAAQAMTALGMTRCYNIIDGFEGPADQAGHRGTMAGWKASGLPWQQK
jgi:rhodanese-related sulfurtransferase